MISGDIVPSRILVLVRMYAPENAPMSRDLYDERGLCSVAGVELQQMRFAVHNRRPVYQLIDTDNISSGVWMQEDFDVRGRYWVIRKKGRLDGNESKFANLDTAMRLEQVLETQIQETEKEREEQAENRREVNRQLMARKSYRDEKKKAVVADNRRKMMENKRRNQALIQERKQQLEGLKKGGKH